VAVEFLDHTADIAARITGRDWKEFFQEAVRALNLILVGEEGLGQVLTKEEVPVDLEAADRETLLVDLLNELIYLFDSKKWILPRLEVEEVTMGDASCRLQGVLRGEKFEPGRHALQTEIKAATFHDLEIRSLDGGLAADVVFDL
jgi:SHS2 domain-containing protein